MTLTLAISTYGARIEALKDWFWDSRVAYLVLWQASDGFSPPPLSANVTVLRLNSRGVAKSRNEAIRQADTEWLWFLDDDVVVPAASLEAILRGIEKPNPPSVYIGSVVDPEGRIMKARPEGYRYNSLSVLKIGTIQILCRLPQVLSAGAWFPEEMGAGAPFPACDEPVFLARLMRGQNKPILHLGGMIVVHPPMSSGLSLSTIPQVRARAIAFREIFGPVGGLLASFAFGLKNLPRIRGRFFDLFYRHPQNKDQK